MYHAVTKNTICGCQIDTFVFSYTLYISVETSSRVKYSQYVSLGFGDND
jgi:hypothetical protein